MMLHLLNISNKVVILSVHVDDTIITSDDYIENSKLKSQLEFPFEIRDLRIFKYFLGTEVINSLVSLLLNRNI